MEQFQSVFHVEQCSHTFDEILFHVKHLDHRENICYIPLALGDFQWLASSQSQIKKVA